MDQAVTGFVDAADREQIKQFQFCWNLAVKSLQPSSLLYLLNSWNWNKVELCR